MATSVNGGLGGGGSLLLSMRVTRIVNAAHGSGGSHRAGFQSPRSRASPRDGFSGRRKICISVQVNVNLSRFKDSDGTYTPVKQDLRIIGLSRKVLTGIAC